MSLHSTYRLCLIVSLSLVMLGCNKDAATNTSASGNGDDSTENSIVLLSVTSDPQADPQSVDMAMKLAGFSLDEGREVVMFFNVKGVTIPLTKFSDELAFKDDTPIKAQLAKLIERGADVHVCPVCMKALGVEEADLMDGANVTTRPDLFANIGAGTAVFTY